MKKLLSIILLTLWIPSLTATDLILASLLEPVQVSRKAKVDDADPKDKQNQNTTKTSEKITPPAKTIMVSEDEILVSLESLLSDRYGVDGELHLIPGRRWNNVRVPGEHWNVEIVRYPVRDLAPSVVLGFRLMYNGEIVNTWQWPFRCEVIQEVLQPQRTFNRGTVVNTKDFDVKKVDTLREPRPLVPAGTDLDGYELAQSVSPGHPLRWQDLSRIPLVRKGDLIEVRASEGLLNITMQALALQDGGKGDVISVRNLISKKTIQGQVIDDNLVQIYF